MNTEVALYQEQQQAMLPDDLTDDGLIALWLSTKASVHTQQAYFNDIKQFMQFVQKPLRSLTFMDVQAYRLSLTGKAATVSRKLASVKSLLTFAQENTYCVYNVAKAVKLPIVQSGLSGRILTEEQVIKMISLESNKRNHTILRLLYHCGLRVSELVALEWKDCVAREHGGQVDVLGKGQKERHIVVEAAMWEELMLLKATAKGPEVFRSKKGGKLRSRQVENIVLLAAQRAGIDLPVSPHWLRHCAISHSLNRGAPIHLVQSVAGHASLTTTTKYAHARPDDGLGRYLAL
jgi:integrase/recombinase XerD